MLLYDMQTHTAKEVEEIFNHLPHGYSTKIKDRLLSNDRNVTTSWIRHIRNFKHKDLAILNLLIELAKESKAVAEAERAKLKEYIS